MIFKIKSRRPFSWKIDKKFHPEIYNTLNLGLIKWMK